MITWKEKGIGLIEHLESHGVRIEHRDNQTINKGLLSDEEVQDLIDYYDPIPKAKNDAKERIRKQSESLMIDIENSYPSFERQTWPYQRLEVEAWEKDNSTPTPTIDAIAVSRQISRDEHLSKTLAKTNEFKSMSNHLAGRRQYFEDLIDNSTDLDFISSVNFEV